MSLRLALWGAATALMIAAVNACGQPSSTASTPSPSPTASNATPSASVLPNSSTPTPTVTEAQAVTIAQQVYRPAPTGGTCDDNGPTGSDHYAACPFAKTLAARFASEAPDGIFTAGPPCQASCSVKFLCQCEYGPITYQDYTATATATGWTVGLTDNNPKSGQWFTLDIATVDASVVVTDIKLQLSNGCTRAIDAPPC